MTFDEDKDGFLKQENHPAEENANGGQVAFGAAGSPAPDAGPAAGRQPRRRVPVFDQDKDTDIHPEYAALAGVTIPPVPPEEPDDAPGRGSRAHGGGKKGRAGGRFGSGTGSSGAVGVRPASVVLGAVSLCLVVLVAMLCVAGIFAARSITSLVTVRAYNNTPPAGSFSVISIQGTIQTSGSDSLGINQPSYHHSATVNHIRQLAENEDNTGILLNMNTPGGGVYESDEVYLALMEYKEATGRPVWAFMGPTCASGGYYICAAADYVAANRNTTTGSIGVYISLTDTSGLYDMLGIETVLVKSGENKGTGTAGVPITEGQRAVYQSVVDECYDQFVGIVAEGRAMDEAKVRTLADGRIYTAKQALDHGLIDEISDWNTVLEAFEEETGAAAFYPNFSRSSTLGEVLGGIFGSLPKGETEAALSAAEAMPNGVPMALYAPEL